MIHVFTYGSLMFEPVWSQVVGGTYRHYPGTVSGFVRREIINEHYPAMLPGPVNATVDGTLYLDIGTKDLSRLDEFEGSIYQRQTVQVMTENNIFSAHAYVLLNSYLHIVSDKEWNPKQFEDHGLDLFLSTYFGFDR